MFVSFNRQVKNDVMILDIQTYISVQVPLGYQMHMLQLFQELHKAIEKLHFYGNNIFYQYNSFRNLIF